MHSCVSLTSSGATPAPSRLARTQADIWRDMYDVENPAEKPELRAYWKFNEGTGNIIKDWSQYGNDAVAHTDLKWNTSVEIPQLNKQE